jgi:hypothetical protein
MPAVWYVSLSAKGLAERVAAPSAADQESGRGYFSAPADRALAEAIVAGDVAKVKSLAPAANLNKEGWAGMSFMRLALENGHANHDVIAILLQNGIDPDQSASLLYEKIYSEKDEALLRVVIDSGVDVNKHMGRGSWILFVRYDWPEELALLLDHGADTETQDGEGYTEIMRATQAQSWPTVEALLAHGARSIMSVTMAGVCVICCQKRSPRIVAKSLRESPRCGRVCIRLRRPIRKCRAFKQSGMPGQAGSPHRQQALTLQAPRMLNLSALASHLPMLPATG